MKTIDNIMKGLAAMLTFVLLLPLIIPFCIIIAAWRIAEGIVTEFGKLIR